MRLGLIPELFQRLRLAPWLLTSLSGPRATLIAGVEVSVSRRVLKPLVPGLDRPTALNPRGGIMRSKLVHEGGGQRTFVVVLQTEDEVMSVLKRFAEEQQLTAAQITGIGAFSAATIAYFDWEKKDYIQIPVKEQVEVASLIGDVATDETGRPALHVHLVLGRRDGSALAGHLSEGRVRPTLEVIITESPAHLHKAIDPESGLALIRP